MFNKMNQGVSLEQRCLILVPRHFLVWVHTMKRAFLKALFDPKKRVLEKEKIDVCVMPWHYLLATVKTASVAILAFSFSPKVTTGLKAKGFKGDVNLLRDTTSESIT
jgi:hypothetical protein